MVGDDYDLQAAVRDDPLGAYVFGSSDPAERARQVKVQRARGTRPWWASDGHYQAVMRPLSSLSHALDFALAGDAPWVMHVENSVLLAALVLLAFGIYRTLGLPPAAVGLAGLFYAFNGNQSMTVGWIAGRNTLLAALFGLGAVALHLRARRTGSAAWLAAAVASAGAALLSAEGGVAALAYIGAHAIAVEEGSGPRRLLRLWPYALVVVGWRIAYALGGYGVAGSAFYRDPCADPVGFVAGVLGAIPIYLASQLTIPYASLSGIAPGAFGIAVVVSLLLLWLLRGLLWPLLRDDPRARFLGLGAAAATVPLGTTLPQDRLVFFVGLGTCGLLALAIDGRLQATAAARPRPSSAGARTLLTLRAVYMPLLFVPVLFSNMNQLMGGGALALRDALPARSDAHVVLLNGPSHLPVHFQWRMRANADEPSPVVDMLYAGAGDATVLRTAPSTLELTVERGWLATTIEGLTRDVSTEPFAAGQVIELPRMRVEVLEVTGRGAPRRVRFELTDDPDSPPRFFAWHDRTPAPIELPPVGGELRLPGISPI